MNKYYMAVDAGTQGLKVAIFDVNGGLVGSAERSYETLHPQSYWATQKPEDWWRALVESSNECIKKTGISPKEISDMCIDGTAPTLVMVDSKGNPLDDAMLWSDRRATAEAERIQSATDEETLRDCGGTILPEWTLPKIQWLKDNHPRYNGAYKILEQVDWLNLKLTEKITTSRLTLIRKAHYDIDLSGWKEGFLEAIGLDQVVKDKLPEDVLPVGKSIGHLLPGIAHELGLSKTTYVAEGGLDSYIGLLGMGVYKPGQIGLIMGSSVPYKIISDKPLHSRSMLGPYKGVVLPWLYSLSGSSPAGGTLIKWVTENSKYADKGGLLALEKQAMQIPIGSNGLLCLPYWDGVKTPVKDPHANGAFVGFDFTHGVEHMFRSVYEAIAYSTKHSLEDLDSMDYNVEEIVVAGGGSKSELLMQIMADVLGRQLSIAFSEASLLGDAMVASYCRRGGDLALEEIIEYMKQPPCIIEPNMENHGIYSELFQKYKQIYPAIKQMER